MIGPARGSPRVVWLVAGSTAAIIVTLLPAFLLGALAPLVRSELGFDRSYVGAAIAISFASISLASPLGGRIGEYLGSQRAMRLSALVATVALVGIGATTRSWFSLVPWMILGGVSVALAQPAANLSLAKGTSSRRGFLFGIQQAGVPLASLVAGVAVPSAALVVGWRWTFVAAGAVSLAVAVAIPAGAAPPARIKGPLRQGDVRLAPLLALSFAAGIGVGAATSLAAFFVESSVDAGISMGDAGWMVALGSSVGVAVRLFAGHLSDGRPGPRLPDIAVLLFLGAVGYALLATTASTPGRLLGVVLATGAGWGWTGLFMHAVVLLNPRAPAAASGLTQFGAATGAASGPFLFGLLVKHHSFPIAWAVAATAALISGLLILGIGAWLRTVEAGDGHSA